MEKIRKAVAIIVEQKDSVLVEIKEDRYAFPSIESKSINDSIRKVKERYRDDISKHEKNVPVDFWRTFEYMDYASERLVLFDCVIIDSHEPEIHFKNYTRVNTSETKPTQFIDEHMTLFEFYSAIPDRCYFSCNELYGQVFLEDDAIDVSFTNERLLQMEINHVMYDDYFPLYFYEFKCTQVLKKNEKLLKRLNEVNGSFFRVNVVDISDEERLKQKQINELVEDPTNLAVIEGDIFYASSPILSKSGNVIVVKEDNANVINKKYDELLNLWENKTYHKAIRNIATINKYLNSKYSGITPSDIDVQIFNVGQANCCYCDFEDRKAFFDIGITYSSSQIETDTSINKAITNDISSLKVDDVILSHWDMDHILGVTYNSDCLIKKTWIAPDPKVLYKANSSKIGISQLRLLNYLHIVGKSSIMLVDTSTTNKTLFTSNVLSIYLGEPKKKHLNALNNGGLIAIVQNTDKLLIPGDCENDMMPFAVASNTYDHIIVPHHGSIMSPPKFKGKKPNKNNIAYMSVGIMTKRSFNEDPGIDCIYNNCDFGCVKKTRDLNGSISRYRFIL